MPAAKTMRATPSGRQVAHLAGLPIEQMGSACHKIADRSSKLSPMRRITVSEFKGSTLVSLREYFEKDGEMRPGKKVGSHRVGTERDIVN